jgi:uncharacterized protein YgbK (DUF1537 family)
VLVPQNPSRGRVIVDGEYRIDGVPLHRSPFAADPEHPATTADVQRLLNPAGTPPSPSIAVGDGSTAADIQRWAARVDERVLPAGGADFFTAILAARGFATAAGADAQLPIGDYLMLCGSASESSRCFVDSTSIVCAMPDALFNPATGVETEMNCWADTIAANLKQFGRAAMAIRQPARRERAGHLRRTMAEVAARVIDRNQPRVLLVEGGATAAALLDRLNWRTLTVVAQRAPGVVALRPMKSLQQLLVLKPGSYPWPIGVA